jgi:hypothetical protein
MKEVFLKNKKIKKFILELKKIFPDKKFLSEKISEEDLELNIKDFEKIFSEIEKIFSENKKKFSEVKIFLENKKKYLEIVNCDLVFDL